MKSLQNNPEGQKSQIATGDGKKPQKKRTRSQLNTSKHSRVSNGTDISGSQEYTLTSSTPANNNVRPNSVRNLITSLEKQNNDSNSHSDHSVITINESSDETDSGEDDLDVDKAGNNETIAESEQGKTDKDKQENKTKNDTISDNETTKNPETEGADQTIGEKEEEEKKGKRDRNKKNKGDGKGKVKNNETSSNELSEYTDTDEVVHSEGEKEDTEDTEADEDVLAEGEMELGKTPGKSTSAKQNKGKRKNNKKNRDLTPERDNGHASDPNVTPKSERSINTLHNQEEVQQILDDPAVAKARNDCLGGYAPLEYKDISDKVLKAHQAIIYINMLQSRTTRLPSKFSYEMSRAMTVITDTLTHLDRELQKTKTLLAVGLGNQGPGGAENVTSVTNTATKNSPATQAKNTFAEAVKTAQKTIIIKDKANKERNPEEIKKQVKDILKQHHDKVDKISNIKGGIAIACEHAEGADKIKEILTNQESTEGVMTVKTAEIRKTKIIIFSVPATLTREQITTRITKNLKLNDKDENVQVTTELLGQNNTKHVIVTLPTMFATNLINQKRILLGLQSCAIKKHISVVRCNKCQSYDHTAHDCKAQKLTCGKCTGEHATESCTLEDTEKQECINCRKFNDMSGREKINSNHATNSKKCYIYSQLLQTRQYVNDNHKSDIIRVEDILRGQVFAFRNREGNLDIHFKDWERKTWPRGSEMDKHLRQFKGHISARPAAAHQLERRPQRGIYLGVYNQNRGGVRAAGAQNKHGWRDVDYSRRHSRYNSRNNKVNYFYR